MCALLPVASLQVWCAETGTVLQRFDACTGGFDLANIGGIEMLNPKCVLIWDSRRVLYEAFVENGFVRRLAETNSTGAHIGEQNGEVDKEEKALRIQFRCPIAEGNKKKRLVFSLSFSSWPF